ncbi:9618_t:CDS:2, partial [Cetraspora pellucida]
MTIECEERQNEELDGEREVLEHGEYAFAGGEDELRSSGMAFADNISCSERSRTLELLEKMINESNAVGNNCAKTILMPHSNNPKNEYTDPTLLPAAFPVLFPYGVGGHEDNL